MSRVAASYSQPSAGELGRVKRARRAARRREVRTAYLFLLPNLAVFSLFLLYPVAMLVKQSLQSGGVLGPAEWVGLQNWKDVFQDTAAVNSLGNTGKFTVMYLPLVLGASLAVALLLRRVTRGGTVIRALVYLPAIAPLVLAATVWTFMVHPDFGLLSLTVRLLGGTSPSWLGEPSLAMATVVSLELWRSVGFWAMLLLAALLAVPEELYAAARVDGASAIRRFLHVTIPGIRLTLLTVLVLNLIAALQVFDSVFVLTGGGPAGATETIGVYVYRSIFESANPGFGAALSLLLVLVTVILTAGLAGLAMRRPKGMG